jgi:hypothetical protein
VWCVTKMGHDVCRGPFSSIPPTLTHLTKLEQPSTRQRQKKDDDDDDSGSDNGEVNPATASAQRWQVEPGRRVDGEEGRGGGGELKRRIDEEEGQRKGGNDEEEGRKEEEEEEEEGGVR